MLMNATSSEQSATPSSPQQRDIIQNAKSTYQGRVRTGCLICRARKVKCDEQRPNCLRCTKSKRTCVYKRGPPTVPIHPDSIITDQQHQNISDKEPVTPPQQTSNRDHLVQEQLFTTNATPSTGQPETFGAAHDAVRSPEELSTTVDAHASSFNHHDAGSFHQAIDLNNAGSPSARFYNTSLQIYVTTTLDWLGASGMPMQSFSYFVEEVDSPIISPFDHLNWKRIKLHVTQLAVQNTSISAAISAVQSVYRAQIDRLPTFHAMSEYQAAIANFEIMLDNDGIDFDTILAVALLLCLCEVSLPNEDGPTFLGFNHTFETRLNTWLLTMSPSPISLRIAIWLQFLHVVTKRVGSCGLLPENVFSTLSNNIKEVPTLSLLDHYTNSTGAMYDIISAPVFRYYLELQRITNEVHDLSHYRRSRITPADQAEVTDIVVGLRKRLTTLWETRPGPLRYQPTQLREHFCPAIAKPLIALAGVCIASFFAEMVELRRTLGDDPFPSPESAEAMRQIRDHVDGDWEVSNEDGLNPGYVRPLFLYAIETLQHDETQWAVTHLKQINSPISRSGFIASLADSLGQAQRKEQRRVATKYFCNGAFNIPVPRM